MEPSDPQAANEHEIERTAMQVPAFFCWSTGSRKSWTEVDTWMSPTTASSRGGVRLNMLRPTTCHRIGPPDRPPQDGTKDTMASSPKWWPAESKDITSPDDLLGTRSRHRHLGDTSSRSRVEAMPELAEQVLRISGKFGGEFVSRASCAPVFRRVGISQWHHNKLCEPGC